MSIKNFEIFSNIFRSGRCWRASSSSGFELCRSSIYIRTFGIGNWCRSSTQWNWSIQHKVFIIFSWNISCCELYPQKIIQISKFDRWHIFEKTRRWRLTRNLCDQKRVEKICRIIICMWSWLHYETGTAGVIRNKVPDIFDISANTNSLHFSFERTFRITSTYFTC